MLISGLEQDSLGAVACTTGCNNKAFGKTLRLTISQGKRRRAVSFVEKDEEETPAILTGKENPPKQLFVLQLTPNTKRNQIAQALLIMPVRPISL